MFLVQEHGKHGMGTRCRGLRGFPKRRNRRQGRLKRERSMVRDAGAKLNLRLGKPLLITL